MEKIVTYAIKPGPLTEEQNTELERLVSLDDSKIDTSDMPELTEEWFERAERGRFYSPTPGHIAIAHDVLEWLGGNDHAAIERVDAILRKAMERERDDVERFEAAE